MEGVVAYFINFNKAEDASVLKLLKEYLEKMGGGQLDDYIEGVTTHIISGNNLKYSMNNKKLIKYEWISECFRCKSYKSESEFYYW